MEQADVGHRHSHVVFVTGLDDIVVADGTASLGDVGDTAFVGALDVVAEGEEGVRAKGDASLGSQPGLFFLRGEYGWFFGEDPLPVVTA